MRFHSRVCVFTDGSCRFAEVDMRLIRGLADFLAFHSLTINEFIRSVLDDCTTMAHAVSNWFRLAFRMSQPLRPCSDQTLCPGTSTHSSTPSDPSPISQSPRPETQPCAQSWPSVTPSARCVTRWAAGPSANVTTTVATMAFCFGTCTPRASNSDVVFKKKVCPLRTNAAECL